MNILKEADGNWWTLLEMLLYIKITLVSLMGMVPDFL